MEIKATIKKLWKSYWWVVVIIGIAIIAVIGLSCGGEQQGTTQGPGDTTCPATHIATTAHNICLPRSWGPQAQHQIDRADGGTVLTELPVTDPQMRAMIAERVVAGVQQTITSIQHNVPSWTNFMSTGQYQVVLIRKQATNQDGTPALVTRGIQTAGTVINVWADGRKSGVPIIVLPQPESFTDNYWPYLQASARHEGEHVAEYQNSIGVFLSKIGAGDVHPHWSLPDEAQGLVSIPWACQVEMSGSTVVSIEGGKTVER